LLELIEELNQTLGIAVVETATGGAGGGTRLTDAGREIVSQYRALEEGGGKGRTSLFFPPPEGL
jgi:molybdate transport repressor ModE-like protein